MLSLLAVLAACDDSVWIEIRVPDGLAVDEVELFLAVDQCEKSGEDCRGLRPWAGADSTVAFIPGTVFEHDTNITFVAPVSAGSASFRLAASEDKLPALIAIGVAKATRVAVGGVVLAPLDLAAGARHVIATLEPDDQDTRVFRWPDPQDPARDRLGCAGVQHRNDPATFVVSPSDWDCDGFANDSEVECNPLFYRASFAKESCAKPAPTGALGDACMLGEGSCQDGVGTACSVVAPSVCVPQKLCDQCTFPDQACLEDEFANTPTHLSCTFPVVKEGVGNYTVCGLDNKTSAVADLNPTATPVVDCLTSPLLTASLFDSDPPASLITFTTDGQLASLGIVTAQAAPCKLSVELGGDLALSYQPQRFPLHLHADGVNRTILVPLEIAITEVSQVDCDNGAVPVDCTFTRDEDTLLRCIRP